MDIDALIKQIESLNDEVDIVQHYSVAIEHLEQMSTQIGFADNPIKFHNDINEMCKEQFVNIMFEDIDKLKKMIAFHLQYRHNNPIKNTIIKESKLNNKLSFNVAYKK